MSTGWRTFWKGGAWANVRDGIMKSEDSLALVNAVGLGARLSLAQKKYLFLLRQQARYLYTEF
jgi:hypothetical protein